MRALAVERDGPGGVVARVHLARPEVHNALDAELIGDLTATFGALAGEPADRLRAVVLAGEGPSFCAGADVGWMRSGLGLGVEGNEADADRLAAMFTAIDGCPAPVIARVHGATLGGGMGLCAAADLVLAEARTTFGFTEARLGILPAVIAPFVLAKVGESQARALFTSGSRFDARRAERIGLVHEVVDGAEALDRRVAGIVGEFLAAGPTAARAAKALIRELRGLAPPEARRLTVARIAAQRASAEGQEGLAAFLERRRPAWHVEGDDRA